MPIAATGSFCAGRGYNWRMSGAGLPTNLFPARPFSSKNRSRRAEPRRPHGVRSAKVAAGFTSERTLTL